jgi:hypothetical protein
LICGVAAWVVPDTEDKPEAPAVTSAFDRRDSYLASSQLLYSDNVAHRVENYTDVQAASEANAKLFDAAEVIGDSSRRQCRLLLISMCYTDSQVAVGVNEELSEEEVLREKLLIADVS